jgi:hypothetical protein
LAKKLTMKLPVVPKDCIHWKLYLIIWMTCLELFTLQNVTCQWMSFWWCGRDICHGKYTSPPKFSGSDITCMLYLTVMLHFFNLNWLSIICCYSSLQAG